MVFVLFLWMLAGVAFPQAHPDAPTVYVWLAGLCATLLFFGSVLAHELSHSLVARALGLRVLGITLFVFGGVSTLAHDPDDGWAEIKVAAAGPLMSFFLAATFWVLTAVAAVPGASPLASAVFGYLALANLVLGLFNLVPGFPLDGGRVLRAVWWIVTGSVSRATQVATRVGGAVAVLMMALGVLQIVAGSLGGVWLILIGLFLWSAAAAARRDMELRGLLEGAVVRDVMIPNSVAVPAEVTLAEAAADQFVRFGLDAFPVARNGQVVGLITLRDLDQVRAAARSQRTVGEEMTPLAAIPAVSPGDAVREAMDKMARAGREQLLVLDGDAPVGFLTLGGVSRFLRLRRGREGDARPG